MPKKQLQKNKKSDLVIYQGKDGAIEFRGDFGRETIWGTQKQIAKMFGVTPQNITIHLKRIFKEGELNEKATCKESLQVQFEGKRQITRKVKEYNLDAIISVGYRINSKTATQFRIWATKILKQHITKGYTINKKTIGKNYDQFIRAVNDVRLIVNDELLMVNYFV